MGAPAVSVSVASHSHCGLLTRSHRHCILLQQGIDFLSTLSATAAASALRVVEADGSVLRFSARSAAASEDGLMHATDTHWSDRAQCKQAARESFVRHVVHPCHHHRHGECVLCFNVRVGKASKWRCMHQQALQHCPQSIECNLWRVPLF